MTLPLSVPLPFHYGVRIITQDHAEDMSSALLNFRWHPCGRPVIEYPREPLGPPAWRQAGSGVVVMACSSRGFRCHPEPLLHAYCMTTDELF